MLWKKWFKSWKPWKGEQIHISTFVFVVGKNVNSINIFSNIHYNLKLSTATCNVLMSDRWGAGPSQGTGTHNLHTLSTLESLIANSTHTHTNLRQLLHLGGARPQR